PGIGISPIADMDAHQTIVTAVLPAENSAETPRRLAGDARSETPRLGSALVVLVVAAPPGSRLVASPGGAVEPLVHAPETVQSARIGGVGVVDDAVLERERAHTRPFAPVRGRVGSAGGREPGDRLRDLCRVQCVAAAPVVVFDAPVALLLLGDRDLEV